MTENGQFSPAVVILEPDLFFSIRLEDVVRAAGGEPVTVDAASCLSPQSTAPFLSSPCSI